MVKGKGKKKKEREENGKKQCHTLYYSTQWNKNDDLSMKLESNSSSKKQWILQPLLWKLRPSTSNEDDSLKNPKMDKRFYTRQEKTLSYRP